VCVDLLFVFRKEGKNGGCQKSKVAVSRPSDSPKEGSSGKLFLIMSHSYLI